MERLGIMGVLLLSAGVLLASCFRDVEQGGGGNATSPPATPTGVIATSGDGQNTLTWNPVTGATSYNLYWSTTSGVTKLTGVQIAGVSSPYDHTGLTNGTTYYYVVTAVGAGGEGADSSEDNDTPADVTAPANVSSLNALPGDTEVDLSWVNPPDSDFAGVRICWDTSAFPTDPNACTNSVDKLSPAISHNEMGLNNGTTYFFTAFAYDEVPNYAAGAQQSATPQIPAPGAPSGVSATAGDQQITISWNPVTGATSYNLYWSTTSGVTKLTGTQIAGVSSPYPHQPLNNGTTYYYVVTAVGAGGEGADSSEVNGTPVDVTAPANVSSFSALPGDTVVDLTWVNPPDSDFDGVRICWDTSAFPTDPNACTNIVDKISPAIGHTVTGLNNGTTYFFTAFAYDEVPNYADGSTAQDSATPSNSGTLDSTFAGTGFVTHHDAAGGNSYDYGKDVILDVTGRIVVTGVSDNGFDDDMALWRYNADGTIDSSFAGQGYLTHDRAGGAIPPDDSGDEGNYVAIDSSNRIIVGGKSRKPPGNLFLMVIWAYNSNGQPDTTFNSSGAIPGIVTHVGDGNSASAEGLFINASDLITIVGGGGTSASDIALWRYNSNGTLDGTFAGSGFISYEAVSNQVSVAIAAGGVDSSGGIVVVGRDQDTSPTTDLFLARYDANGSVDTLFGFSGQFTYDSGFNEEAYAATIDGNDRIIVVGEIDGAGFNMEAMAIWRFNANGSIDTSFGVNGLAAFDTGSRDFGYGVVIDASGRLVVTGWSSNQMTLWRYNPDGTLDTTFVGTGVKSFALPGNGGGNAVRIDGSGRYVVTGWSTNGTNNDMTIWRVNP